MADVSKTVAIIFQGQDQTGAALASVEKNLAGIGNEAGNAGAGLGKLGGDMDGLAGKGDTLSSALSKAFGAVSATLIISAFIDANVAAERFELTMKTLTGSQTAAGAEFEYVKGVANRLGLELFATADAYGQLFAATNGTNLAGQATRDIFEAVARAMAALGKSSSDTEGALLAISQMVSKGTVSMEELRGQLGERLPGAFQAAAASMGLSTTELDKLVSSGKLATDDFLPKFAAQLNKSFGGAEFDTYTGNLNRLKNSVSDAFLIIGDAGVFDALKTGLQLGTAAIVGAQAATVLLGETLGNMAYTIASGDWSGFGARLDASMEKAAKTTQAASDALLGAEKSAAKVGDAGQAAGEKVAAGMKFSADESFKAWKAATEEIDRSLKALGIDPKVFLGPVVEVTDAFKTLAGNAQATGEQIVVGLTAALQKLPQDASLDEFRRALAYAFRDGKVSLDELNAGLTLLDVKQRGLAPSFGPVTQAAKDQAEALKKQADETKKAEEAAAKMALELEKLASNERIKYIEAKVKLNVAEVEAETKRIEAAFQSIDNTVKSTGDQLSDLFKLFSNEDNLSFTAMTDIRDQIDLENKRRDDALALQRDLTMAQIEHIRQQTRQLDRGDSLIRIEGAGLQPHLEAFMWEILRTIQVKVNAQGLALLLGA